MIHILVEVKDRAVQVDGLGDDGAVPEGGFRQGFADGIVHPAIVVRHCGDDVASALEGPLRDHDAPGKHRTEYDQLRPVGLELLAHLGEVHIETNGEADPPEASQAEPAPVSEVEPAPVSEVEPPVLDEVEPDLMSGVETPAEQVDAAPRFEVDHQVDPMTYRMKQVFPPDQ